MKLEDPSRKVSFVVRASGETGVGTTSLVTALLEFPVATDEDLTRLQVLEADEAPERHADLALLVVRGGPTDASRVTVSELEKTTRCVVIAVHARDLQPEKDDEVRAAWGAVVDPARVHLTSTAKGSPAHGVDDLRAALVTVALQGMDLPIDRARKAKRPYATAIIAGAALVTAAEGLLPGAAAFVIATQVGAIVGLYYLYTGRTLARSQALAMLPVFASQAVGGSVFLVVKSFLPPTGVADAIAAGVAASMTISMLGAVTWVLEQGYSLQEKEQLVLAFKRMQARSKAERARISRNKKKWNDKDFWADVVRRVVFD